MRLFSPVAIIATLAAVPAAATQWIANASNVDRVFAAAAGGDSINLIGNFGSVTFQNRSFTTPLKINANGASISDTLTLRDVNGIDIRGGRYGSLSQPLRQTKAIALYGGSNISFTAPIVVGAGVGQGLAAAGTTDLSISGGHFLSLKLGIGLTSVRNVTVTGNQFRKSASDGIDVVDSHFVTIARNNCSAGAPADGAHPDCVQMWSLAGNPVQSDITIIGNYAGGATQGFTSFDSSRGGGLRIKILNNRVDTSFPQGIACYQCDNSVITGNVLTTLPGAPYRTSINAYGKNIIIAGNSVSPKPAALVAARSLSAPTGVTIADAFIPDENYYAYGAGPATVPEPGIWLQLLTGFAALGMLMRRRAALA